MGGGWRVRISFWEREEGRCVGARRGAELLSATRVREPLAAGDV